MVAWKSTLTPFLKVLVVLLCLAGCASAVPQDGPDLTRTVLTDLLVQLERNPIGPGEELRITRLVESPEMSGLLVQVRGAMPLHYHKLTQEIVYLLQGEGMFQMGTERVGIRAGAIIRISPGQVHTFTNQGPSPAVFFVVTTPRWDEQDRFVVTP